MSVSKQSAPPAESPARTTLDGGTYFFFFLLGNKILKNGKQNLHYIHGASNHRQRGIQEQELGKLLLELNLHIQLSKYV